MFLLCFGNMHLPSQHRTTSIMSRFTNVLLFINLYNFIVFGVELLSKNVREKNKKSIENMFMHI